MGTVSHNVHCLLSNIEVPATHYYPPSVITCPHWRLVARLPYADKLGRTSLQHNNQPRLHAQSMVPRLNDKTGS